MFVHINVQSNGVLTLSQVSWIKKKLKYKNEHCLLARDNESHCFWYEDNRNDKYDKLLTHALCRGYLI